MIRLGTRGSALALAQARWVAARVGDEAELVEITTDREARSPTTSRARSTATVDTLTRSRPTPVSERARLPACRAAPKRRLVSGPVVPACSAAS